MSTRSDYCQQICLQIHAWLGRKIFSELNDQDYLSSESAFDFLFITGQFLNTENPARTDHLFDVENVLNPA